MQLEMLKAKLHRVKVTHSERDYKGSCAIDATLLAIASILEYEKIDIYNISNGERFTTYAIRAPENSGIISVNGAAALKADPGNLIIICAYALFDQSEAKTHRPIIVPVDDKNRAATIKSG